MVLASTFNWSYLFIAVAIGLLFGLIISKNKQFDKSRLQFLDVKEFADTMRKGTLVDIRSEKEFDIDKIIGAKNFKGKSGASSSAVRKDIPIFLYDEKGSKVNSCAKSYVRKGAVMVYMLKGGFEAYKAYKDKK